MRFLVSLISICLLVACSPELPEPVGLGEMEGVVQEQYRELAQEVLEAPRGSREEARAIGRLGIWNHAYQQAEGAESCYRRALASDPGEAAWPYYLGMLLAVSSRRDEAESWFRRVLELEPDNAAARVRLAEIELDAGRLEEAERLFREARERDERSVRALVGLAELAQRRRDVDEAVSLLREALDLQVGGEAPILHALGLAYRARGDAELAVRYLEKAQAATGDKEALRMDDPRAATLRAEDIGSLTSLARARRAARTGERQRALRHFEIALRADPDNRSARNGKARVLLALHREDEAEEILKDVLAEHPDDAEAHWGLGLVLSKRGELAAARDELVRAVALDRDLVGAQVDLAELLLALDEREAALAPLQAARLLRPEASERWREEADVLLSLGRLQEAAALLGEAAVLRDRGLTLWHAVVLAATSEEPGERQRALGIAWQELTREPALDAAGAVTLCLAALGTKEDVAAARRTLEEASDSAGQADALEGFGGDLEVVSTGRGAFRWLRHAETLEAIFVPPRSLEALVGRHLP